MLKSFLALLLSLLAAASASAAQIDDQCREGLGPRDDLGRGNGRRLSQHRHMGPAADRLIGVATSVATHADMHIMVMEGRDADAPRRCRGCEAR